MVPGDLGLLLPKWFGQVGGVAKDVSVDLMRRKWLQTWGWVQGHEAAAGVGWPETMGDLQDQGVERSWAMFHP